MIRCRRWRPARLDCFHHVFRHLGPGSANATSVYDASPLRETLEQLVDFDRINSNAMRLMVGAVNVQTGDVVRFDTATHRFGLEHILASSALPPAIHALRGA